MALIGQRHFYGIVLHNSRKVLSVYMTTSGRECLQFPLTLGNGSSHPLLIVVVVSGSDFTLLLIFEEIFWCSLLASHAYQRNRGRSPYSTRERTREHACWAICVYLLKTGSSARAQFNSEYSCKHKPSITANQDLAHCLAMRPALLSEWRDICLLYL